MWPISLRYAGPALGSILFGLWIWSGLPFKVKEEIHPRRFAALEAGRLYRSGRIAERLVPHVLDKYRIGLFLDLAPPSTELGRDARRQRTRDAAEGVAIMVHQNRDDGGLRTRWLNLIPAAGDPRAYRSEGAVEAEQLRIASTLTVAKVGHQNIGSSSDFRERWFGGIRKAGLPEE